MRPLDNLDLLILSSTDYDHSRSMEEIFASVKNHYPADPEFTQSGMEMFFSAMATHSLSAARKLVWWTVQSRVRELTREGYLHQVPLHYVPMASKEHWSLTLRGRGVPLPDVPFPRGPMCTA